MKSRYSVLLIFALLLVILTACSAPAAPAPTPTPPPAPTEQPAPTKPAVVFPTGLFISTKDKAVAYQFNPDGTFGFFFASLEKPVVEGVYKTRDNLLTVEVPADTDPKCKGEATYQWSFDGKNLSFAPYGNVEDTCKGRRDSFADTYVYSNQ